VLAILNGALIAGIFTLGRQAALEGVSPLALVYWQSLSSAIIVSVIAGMRGERPRFPVRDARHYAIAGLMGIGTPVLAAFAPRGTISLVLLAVLGAVLLAAGAVYRGRDWPAGLSPLGVASGLLIVQALVLDPIVAYEHAIVLPSAAFSRLDWVLIATSVLSSAFYVSALALTASAPGRTAWWRPKSPSVH
jgi:hypothetical protein